MEKRYTVRQASMMTGVKAYVLRYWEDELELEIKRNEMGHRYYTETDIQLLMHIKDLKNKGLQLRAIKTALPQIVNNLEYNIEKNKVSYLISEECRESEDKIIDEVELEETKDNEKIIEFQMILERLIAQELNMKNEEEERCRSLDAAIRRQQKARKEIAAALVDKKGQIDHTKNRK